MSVESKPLLGRVRILSTSSCPHERKQERKCSWGHEPVPSSTILLKGEPQQTFQTQR
ncbi:MAG: hypothetical protein ACI95K_001346 [Lentimonas sp.]|jgi:hypothetical protein